MRAVNNKVRAVLLCMQLAVYTQLFAFTAQANKWNEGANDYSAVEE